MSFLSSFKKIETGIYKTKITYFFTLRKRMKATDFCISHSKDEILIKVKKGEQVAEELLTGMKIPLLYNFGIIGGEVSIEVPSIENWRICLCNYSMIQFPTIEVKVLGLKDLPHRIVKENGWYKEIYSEKQWNSMAENIIDYEFSKSDNENLLKLDSDILDLEIQKYKEQHTDIEAFKKEISDGRWLEKIYEQRKLDEKKKYEMIKQKQEEKEREIKRKDNIKLNSQKYFGEENERSGMLKFIDKFSDFLKKT